MAAGFGRGILTGVSQEGGADMKKPLVIGGAVLGAALVARRAAAHCKGIDFEAMIERMPENAPPKWMFRNITAIRANTERILDVLEPERKTPGAEQLESLRRDNLAESYT
jgi:hypothetical protein